MKKFYLILALVLCVSTVFSLPVITSQPSSMTKCLGSTAALSVTATGTSLTYQWKKNGVNIPGQTSSVLNFLTLALSDDATYSCVVTDAVPSSVTSIDALIHVVPAAPSITSQPSNQVICEGNNASLTVVASGLILGFQWIHDGVNIPNAFSDTYSLSSAVNANSGSYTCNISNACGSVTTSAVTLTVNIPPQITDEPVNQVVCLDHTAYFSVTANGTGLFYKWEKDGSAISGANNSTLLIPNISVSDEATYTCTIWNNCDTIVSNSVVLTTIMLPSVTAQPYSYNECSGDSFSFITTVVGTPPITYQWYHQGNVVTDSTNNTLTINNTTTPDGGSYFCAITNICGTIHTDTVTLSVKQPPTIVQQPDGRIRCFGDTVSFSVKVAGEEPFTYQWLWQGTIISGANMSNFALININEGDAGSYSCFITNLCGEITTDTAMLEVQTPPVIVLEPSGSTVCEATYTVLTVQVQGSELISYSWTHNGSILPGSGHENYTINPITPASAGTYQCFASNACGADTSSTIIINVNTLPYVTVQPADQMTCINGNVTFSMSAAGTGPLTYHWLKDNVQIGNATDTSYSLTNIQPFDEGNYTCQIYNICGDTLTNIAVLIVNDAPLINTTLYNRTRCEGDSVSFHVNADGGSLSYQWVHDGNPVVTETTSVLLYNDPTISESGSYYCIALNNCGADTTNTITLTVNPRADVDLGEDVTLCHGDSVILTAGSFQLYHWNETMATTPSIEVDTAGTFILEAWNQYSCKGSDTVVVTVNQVLQVSLGNDTAVCGNFNLNAGSGAASYNWNNGQGFSQVYTVTVTGTYSVVVTAVGGCQSGDEINITVNSIPVFSLGNDTSITNTDTLILTGPAGNYTYYWAGAGSNSQSLTIYGSEVSLGLHSYMLEVTNEWGCKTTDAVNVTILVDDISELNSDDNVCIYPNPSSGIISLTFERDTYMMYQLEILNVLGQVIYSKEIERGSGNVSSIDLSTLPKGNYYLKLKAEENYIVKKITIQ